MYNARKREGKLNVIGNNIKYYRREVGLSQQELSNQLMLLGIDIPKQGIYKIEKGIRTVVDYELCVIAKCLKVLPDDLLKDYWEEIN